MGEKKSCIDVFYNQQGMALLITIMTLSLLVAVTMQFHKNVWHKYLAAHNYKVGIQLQTIATSGVNIGMALIGAEKEEQESDTLLSDWATLDETSFLGMFSAGDLQLQISDLSGRFQVNSLVQGNGKEQQGDKKETEELQKELRETFQRLLLSGSFAVEDEGQANSIVAALIDWIDEDDRESDHGAEDSYYRSLENPYGCRNGKVQYIEELLLVKGITAEIFFGTEKKEGLVDYLSVYGNSGKININTAPLPLLKSLHQLVTNDLLEPLDEYRREEGSEDRLSQPGWYKDVSGWPGDIVFNEKILTTESAFFQITATGTFDTLSKQAVGVATRSEDGKVKLLRIKVQ